VNNYQVQSIIFPINKTSMTRALSYILCEWRKYLKFCFHEATDYRCCENCYIFRSLTNFVLFIAVKTNRKSVDLTDLSPNFPHSPDFLRHGEYSSQVSVRKVWQSEY